MTLFRFKCQRCETTVEMTREQYEVSKPLTCPRCAAAGTPSPLLPTCKTECSTDGSCGCAISGFSCS